MAQFCNGIGDELFDPLKRFIFFLFKCEDVEIDLCEAEDLPNIVMNILADDVESVFLHFELCLQHTFLVIGFPHLLFEQEPAFPFCETNCDQESSNAKHRDENTPRNYCNNDDLFIDVHTIQLMRALPSTTKNSCLLYLFLCRMIETEIHVYKKKLRIWGMIQYNLYPNSLRFSFEIKSCRQKTTDVPEKNIETPNATQKPGCRIRSDSSSILDLS